MHDEHKFSRRIWPAIAPHPILAVLILMVSMVELAIVFSSASSFRSTDLWTQTFGAIYILWFWLTTGWVLHFNSKLWRHQSKSTLHTFVKSLAVVILAVCVLTYCISWGLFFKTGRMANFEAVRFMAFNFRYLWDYLSQAEPIQLVFASVLVIATLLVIPLFLRRIATSHWNLGTNRNRQPIIVWLCLTCVTFASWRSIPSEPGSLKRANRRRALTQELHPSFSVLVSYLESASQSKVRPTLDANQLIRISSHRGFQSAPLKKTNGYSVIYVAIEALRHDTIQQFHQGKEVLPNINRLAQKGVRLTNAYAESTHSDYSDVCLVSSLYPLRTRHHHYYDKTDPWPKTLIYDVLKPRGYATAIISSQNEMWGGMSNFLESPNLDFFYHPETAGDDAVFQETSSMDRGFAAERKLGNLKAGKFPDHYTTTRAIEWIRQQSRHDHPFFLSMNFQSSHFPYLTPKETPRPFQPCDLNANISFANYPKSETEKVKNAYYNAIHECDRQVGRLVESLRELGRLDKTILVITGENGEAFHECASVTHAREPVEPAIHIACILHAPGLLTPREDSYPFEHVDLVPTTFALLGLETHPNFQGINVFSSHRIDPDNRLTFCHVNTCFAQCDSIMLGGRWKLVIDRSSGARNLFDSHNDPNEEKNLLRAKPELAQQLTQRLEAWRNSQLAYYHFPQYYVNFYPPHTPEWIPNSTTIFVDKQPQLLIEQSR